MKKFVPIKSISELKFGDLIRHINYERGLLTNVYLVTGNYGERATAIDTVDVTNPSEWTVFREE